MTPPATPIASIVLRAFYAQEERKAVLADARGETATAELFRLHAEIARSCAEQAETRHDR